MVLQLLFHGFWICTHWNFLRALEIGIAGAVSEEDSISANLESNIQVISESDFIIEFVVLAVSLHTRSRKFLFDCIQVVLLVNCIPFFLNFLWLNFICLCIYMNPEV